MTNEKYMRFAIALAEKGAGFVNPNPLVGAVIVKEGRMIGQGYHKKYGGLHAERDALASCTQNPGGATMYVTLEPCCHHGKTPPCTKAIQCSGIKKVVVGCLDPNPLVSGKGVKALTDAGIAVVCGVLEAECRKQNAVFFQFIREKTPYVVMKYAMTADGKIATTSGASKWITGEEAREQVHSYRNRYMGIMVGVDTVLADDPLLTCRLRGGRNPIRLICDTNLRIPVYSQIVKTAKESRTVIATACKDEQAKKPLLEAGCEIVEVPVKENHIDLQVFMKMLGEMGIDSILLEGGGTLNFSALASGIVHKVQAYIAPKIFGGANAKTPVGGMGFPDIAGCIQLKNLEIAHLGKDIFIESEVVYPCLPGLLKKQALCEQ